MKRFFSMALLAILCIFALSACSSCGSVTVSGNGNTSANKLYIIPPSDDLWDSAELINSMYTDMNNPPVITSDSAEKLGDELVIGNSEREVSKKAYLHLNRLVEDNPDKCCAVIYAYQGSVCIAYNSKYSAELAAEYFTQNLANFINQSLKNGKLYENVFDLAQLAEQEREELRNDGFIAAEQTLGKEAVDELRNLYSIFVPDMYLWLVNLYDQDTGGMYYSNSARNTEGFLPDLESTVQGFSLLSNTGILPNGWRNDLPEDIKSKIIEFAVSLQDESGYFYHPQWGTNIQTSRRSRDLGWAKRIITELGGTSKYPFPGESIDLNPVSSNYSLPLGHGTAYAASRVIAVNRSSLPSYLQSLSAFENYLDSLNFKTRSYQVGNDLAAQHNEIAAAGKEYVDFLIDYLSERQNPENGLWEDEVTYSSVNGLMKLASVFWYYSASMPYPEEALQSAVEMTLHSDLGAFSESDIHVCSVYNPWISMSYVLQSVEASQGRAAMLKLRNIIIQQAPELIRMTTVKIAPFRKDDGGFSYLLDYCSPGSQGVPTAVEGTPESDVNGTGIASTGITGAMEDVFGVNLPYYFGEIDAEIAMEELLNLGAIIKEEAPETFPESFDDWTDELIRNETVNGIIPELGSTSYTNVTDGDLDQNNNYKWFSTTITENPIKTEIQEETDYVLKVNTYLYPGEEKDKANTASSVRFDVVQSNRTGSCYVFETDMLVASSTGSSTVGQLFFISNKNGSAFSLNFNKYTSGGNEYIRIGENYEGLDGKKDGNIADKIPFGEWFNIRVEIYRGRDADSNVTVDALIYINGEYQGQCDAGYVSGSNTYFSSNPLDIASFSCYRHSASEIYFNNVLVERIKKDYVAPPPKPLNDGTYDFTDEPIGESCPEGADTIVQGGEMQVVEIDGNKVFKFADTSASKTNAMKFNLSEIPLEGANAYLYESQITINSTTDNDMNFGFLNEKGTIILNTRAVLTQKGDKYDLVITTKSSDEKKDGLRLCKMTVENTFTYAIVYFPDLASYNLIINGNVVAASDALYNESSMSVGTSWFWSGSNTLLDAYFDNIKVLPVILDYVVPEVEEEDKNTPYYGIYNFEKEDTGATDPEGSTILHRNQGEILEVVDYNGNKVWHIHNPGTASSLSAQFAWAKEASADANAYVHEADLKINSITDYLELQFGILGKKGLISNFNLVITDDSNGAYNAKINNNGTHITTVKLTTDFNKITLVYFLERQEWTIKINGSVVASFNVETTDTPKTSWFWVRQQANADIYLDNVLAMTSNITYEPPTEVIDPNPGEGEGGGETPDPNPGDGEIPEQKPDEGDNEDEEKPKPENPVEPDTSEFLDYDTNGWHFN